jgi:hypothetical protein
MICHVYHDQSDVALFEKTGRGVEREYVEGSDG